MIHVLCALHCEAKPLIEYYRLKRRHAEDIFPVYIDRQENISVTVSGIGKINAAAATMYTHGSLPARRTDAWLNVGVAAHEFLELGEIILAQCIHDMNSRKTWYPPMVFDPPCPRATLLTVDTPATAYLDKLIDMEGAGFYATACQLAPGELIQAIKIISDNRANPAAGINQSMVERLISGKITILDKLILSLQDLSAELQSLESPPPSLQECLAKWHLSRYQQNQLYRLLQRWQILCPETSPLNCFSDISDGKTLLKTMQQQLDEQPIRFTDGVT